jgi:uncharacterized membrane protein
MSGSQEQGLSIYRLRLVGYGLLLFALADTLLVFYPPQFTNAAWELQTMGAVVERLPVPLLGLVMVFFGEDYERNRLEDIFLKIVSWFSLLLAIAFLLLLPLGINNTLRINAENNQGIQAQAQQRQAELEAVETQVNQSSTGDLQNLALELNRMGLPVDTANTQELKSDILARVATAKEKLPGQTQAARNSQRQVLLKNSFKWNLGALIGSILFFYIWRGTYWAR